MFAFLQSQWFIGSLFGSLLTIWTSFYLDFNYNSHISCLNYVPIKNIESKDGQLVLERVNCTKAGFDEESIIRVNSDPLPNRTWNYDPNNGVCSGKNRDKCLPGFVETEETLEYYISKPTKIVHCIVAKSMSRVFKSLSCLLNDPLKFFYHEKDLIRDAFDKGCDDNYDTHFERIPDIRRKWNATNKNGWTFAMIVRDPLERFLSGFIHLCILGSRTNCRHHCSGCGPNLTCFLEKTTQKLSKMAKNGKHIDEQTHHLIPQSWSCELHTFMHNFTFLRYNSDSRTFYKQELGPFLRSKNVSSDALSYIRNRMISTRTVHSTHGFRLKSFLEERVRKSPYLLRMVVRLFYNDYIAFNFTLPKVLD